MNISKLINTILSVLHIRRRIYICQPNKDREAGSKQPAISICYAITVCREAEQLQKLLTTIRPYIGHNDEIIIQADKNNVTAQVQTVVKNNSDIISKYAEYPLNYDFAAAKNHLNSMAKADYIFQIDADEIPNTYLLTNIKAILYTNKDIELFKVARNNCFVNSTDFTLTNTDKQYINWPDYQGRIYRNTPRIRWNRPRHERITGHHSYIYLPAEEEYSLLHIKNSADDHKKWIEYDAEYQNKMSSK